VLLLAIRNKRIQELINRLSERDLQLVTDLMERLAEANKYSEIPWDDEPTTQEDIDAIKEAQKAYETDELIDLKDIKNEFRD
jgi:hypothetical protein